MAEAPPISHRKAEPVSLEPPAPQVDPQLITIREAVRCFDRNNFLTREDKKFGRQELEKLEREIPDVFNRIDQLLPEKPSELEVMIKLNKTIDESGLSGKEKRRSKLIAAKKISKESQKAEKKVHHKSMNMSVMLTTKFLLTSWLQQVHNNSSNGHLDQAFCDVNEFIRVIGELKARPSFLPEMEAQALRTKVSLGTKLGQWMDVTSGLEVMAKRFPKQSFTKDTLFLATIYLSRVLHGSIEQELKPHFNPEKAFSCIMRLLPCEELKSEEFYQVFPEYRYLLDGLVDLKSNSGKRTHELFNRCKEALDSCKNPNQMFDLVILPCISAHMHIHRGNAGLAMDQQFPLE